MSIVKQHLRKGRIVKSHTRKGRVVKQHGRTLKKKGKFVSDSGARKGDGWMLWAKDNSHKSLNERISSRNENGNYGSYQKSLKNSKSFPNGKPGVRDMANRMPDSFVKSTSVSRKPRKPRASRLG